MSTVTKRGLKRGLEALLSPSALAAAQTQMATTDMLKRLPIALITPNPKQPRQQFDEEALANLAASIRVDGVLQPVVVRPVGDGRYHLIAGERRWRASQMAGLTEIPALIRNVSDEKNLSLALVENIQRENLSPLEEAEAFEWLVKEHHYTHQQIADAVGKSRVAVSNLLRLLELADEAKVLLREKRLEMGHARALLSLPKTSQGQWALRAADNHWSVREIEQKIRAFLAGNGETVEDKPTVRDPHIISLERELSTCLRAPVQVQHNATGRGQITIKYYSLDELDGILEYLKKP